MSDTIKLETICKFCRTTLMLEIDKEYHALKDPYGLIKLAACDRCADLRDRRARLHEKLVRTCSNLMSNPKDKDIRDAARSAFDTLTKKYVLLISDWTGQQLAWEEAMVEPFMHAPKSLGKHLRALWRMTQQGSLGV